MRIDISVIINATNPFADASITFDDVNLGLKPREIVPTSGAYTLELNNSEHDREYFLIGVLVHADPTGYGFGSDPEHFVGHIKALLGKTIPHYVESVEALSMVKEEDEP